jgi:hypothetical protein
MLETNVFYAGNADRPICVIADGVPEFLLQETLLLRLRRVILTHIAVVRPPPEHHQLIAALFRMHFAASLHELGLEDVFLRMCPHPVDIRRRTFTQEGANRIAVLVGQHLEEAARAMAAAR